METIKKHNKLTLFYHLNWYESATKYCVCCKLMSRSINEDTKTRKFISSISFLTTFTELLFAYYIFYPHSRREPIDN